MMGRYSIRLMLIGTTTLCAFLAIFVVKMEHNVEIKNDAKIPFKPIYHGDHLDIKFEYEPNLFRPVLKHQKLIGYEEHEEFDVAKFNLTAWQIFRLSLFDNCVVQ